MTYLIAAIAGLILTTVALQAQISRLEERLKAIESKGGDVK